MFMNWLKSNHTRLYRLYKLHIVVSTDNDGIKASVDYIEPGDKNAIREVINEYYTTVD